MFAAKFLRRRTVAVLGLFASLLLGLLLLTLLAAGERPDLAWSTFLGGDSDDGARDIATDASGNVYVTGYALSSDFPVPGGNDTSFNGGYYDAFVSKFGADGSLLWSTFLGGFSLDIGNGIATDGSGNVYITGRTMSSDFPVPGGYDTSYNGLDAFVSKFSADGSLLWSTFLGGESLDP